MCGIVGYIGNNQAAPFLLDGMSKLEYRGYDSAGIAVYEKGKITVEKCVGRLDSLRQKLDGHMPEGTINGNLIIDSTLTYFSSVAGIGMGLLNIAAGVGTVYLGMKSGS